MKRLTTSLIASALLFLAAAAPASAAQEWEFHAFSNTTVAPVDKVAPVDNPETTTLKENEVQYHVQARNVGDKPMDGSQIELVLELPPGFEVVKAAAVDMSATKFFPCFDSADGVSSAIGADGVVCRVSSPIPSLLENFFSFLRLDLIAAVVNPSAAGSLLAQAEISGGGASTATTVDPITVTEAAPVFGFDAFEAIAVADKAGTTMTQAGGHPYQHVTEIDFNTMQNPNPSKGHLWPVEAPRDIAVELPPGFVGNPTILDECSTTELAGKGGLDGITNCPATSQAGTVMLRMRAGGDLTPAAFGPYGLFNMVPRPGSPARFGFNAWGSLIFFDAELRSNGDYGLTVGPRGTSQALAIAGSRVTFWGVPSSKDHDRFRTCPPTGDFGCASGSPERPFFRMPTSCTAAGEGVQVRARMNSWANPGNFVSRTIESHEGPGYPHPPSEWGPPAGIDGCEDVPVKGKLSALPTSIDTTTPSGLEVEVEVPNPGLDNPTGIASSDIKKVKVTLPEGLTVNPSQAEGLGACLPGQYASTELSFFPTPGKGCPDDAKIGTVSVETPLLEETIPGDVYIAQPYENPFGSLLALYVVMEEPQRGVLIKIAGKVETNPATGQIVTTFDDLPQLPFDRFEFRFREGSRAPLVTPQACGAYTTRVEFTGHSDPNGAPVVSESSFEIVRGIGGSACPSGGIPPFKPGLLAGTRNNNAGSYSPFDLRLFRTDAEQQFTNFSIKLPPGLTGKLAGIPFCPDAAIAAAKDPNRTGAQELATPSCPPASEVGRTLVGAGVGPVQAYVPGKIYLAGPYNGSALSIAAITAAKVGPFDLGTVVVREALRVNPETAEVFIDAAGSDPLPRIIDGIPTKLRDIRAYVERPSFVLNPTNCDPTSVASTVLGSGLDFANPADDAPVTVSTRFQAANCAALPFKPKLALSLKGGTKRGGHPALRAVLRMKGGEANIAKAQVTLPHSAFLAQSHIRTICTRVQFRAEACPKGSIYGYARAVTPLLDEPLQGPVYLRSSNNPLPDLVAALRSGRIDIDLAGRIDSVNGGEIRSTFTAVPDAPVSKFILTMQGGKKGLIENSANLCSSTNRSTAVFTGHNGKRHRFAPELKPRSCTKGKAAKKKR